MPAACLFGGANSKLLAASRPLDSSNNSARVYNDHSKNHSKNYSKNLSRNPANPCNLGDFHEHAPV